MRINPMNVTQFALKPGQVSPMAAAIQAAPQYIQAMQKAQQSMIGSAAAKNTLAFQNPMLQQALAQKQAQTHIQQVNAAFANPQAQALLNKANADAGVAQASRNVAMSTIGAHVANAKAITAGNQYLAAKQNADAVTAGVAASVAQQTAGQKVAQAKAATISAQQGAKQQTIKTKYAPKIAGAEIISKIGPTASHLASSPTAQAASPFLTNAVGNAEKTASNSFTGTSKNNVRPSPFHLSAQEINELPMTMWKGQFVHVDKKTGLHYPIALNMGFKK